MAGSNGSRARQSVVTNGMSFKDAEAFLSSNGKELPKECFNRKILLSAHEQGRLAIEQELQRNGKYPAEKLCGSVEAGDSPPSSSPNSLPVSSLKEIFLPQLEIDKRHHGRVLFGTFCVRPFKISFSVMSVLADKSGKAVRLSMDNLPLSLSGQSEIEARFPLGQKVAIKEPYLKFCADGKVTIRVENPADIVLVDDSNKETVVGLDVVLQELDGIRAEGNRLFALQKWMESIEQYSRCIARGSAVAMGGDNEKINQCLLLAFSNRSEVWLQQLDFKNALDDANKALEFDPTHQKSISRRDRAWQGFGKVTTSKVKVPVEDTIVAEQPKREDKGLASKSKPKDGSQPAATAPKVRTSKGNPPSSNGTAAGNGSDSKSVSPPFTPPKRTSADSKNKFAPSISPKGKGGNSRNFTTGENIPSKGKATERKSISPTARASKVQVVESRDHNTSARATPTKGKLSTGNPDPPSAAERNLAPSYNGKIAAAALHLWNQSSDSDSDSVKDSSSPEKSVVNEDDYADEIERNLITAAGSASRVVSWSSDSLIVAPKPADPAKPMAGAVDIELPFFAAWLDGIRSSADVLLSQGNWADAVKIYDRVTGFPLPQKNRDKVIQTLLLAYSHRSEAWIWIGDYKKSLRDAHSAVRIVDNHPKSVVGFEGKHLLNEVRRGKAFHGLGDYETAISAFQQSQAKSPGDKSIADLLQKSRVALEQSQNGIYDLDEYFSNGCQGPPPPCSDFVGPVEICRVPGKGRGLLVTRDVEAGDLLLVSNPLLVVRRRLNTEDEEDYSNLTSNWRRSKDGDSAAGLSDFVKRLARLRNEQQICQLLTLTGGNPEDETEIPKTNVFASRNHLSAPPGWEGYASSDKDLHKLQRRAVLNAIEGGLNPLDSAKDRENDETICCVGVWALPSFLNHSCIPNCHMIDVGNTMFVRASRNIREGEELTRAYFDVYQNSLERQRLCAEWNFVCDCDRCSLEKTLTDQRRLPLHEYRNLLERVREESLKRSERERSLSVLLPNPQPALLKLRKFADWCDGFLHHEEDLGNKEKAWIGASHLEAYISRFHVSKDRNQFILGLENLLEFMTNTAVLAVGCSTACALERAAELLQHVEEMYGQSSQTFRRIETRVLELYHATYGGLSKEVFFKMSRFMIKS